MIPSMKMTLRQIIPSLLAVLLLVGTVWAGPLEDANRAYLAKDYKRAISLLAQAQREDPTNPAVYAAMGKTYRKLGNDAAAREAYTEFLRLDPNLSTVRPADRQNFLNAFRAIGGKIPTPAQNRQPDSGQPMNRTSAQDIIRGLTEGDVFVVPSLRDEVNQEELQQVATSLRPLKVKTLVTAGTGGYRSREELAEDLRKRLKLNPDSVLIVATTAGVSATSERLNNDQINRAIQESGLDGVLSTEGPTAMVATAMRAAAKASVQDRNTDSGLAVGAVAVAGLGVGGFLLMRRAKQQQAMNTAKERVEGKRQAVIQSLSYVDGYIDILPRGEDADQAKRLRASAFEKFDTANGLIKSARKPEEVEQALPLLTDAERELTECRQAIDRATGGTGIAMGLLETPDLATDIQKAQRYRKAEELRTAEERIRLQQEVEALPAQERGVSFFSGRPMPSSALIPVTVVVSGQKRTVMATPEEAEMILQGRMPPVRSFRDRETGRYIPWYEYSNYDPYRDYYAYDSRLLAASVMMDLITLSTMLDHGIHANYGPWGWQGYGWGMPAPSGGYVIFDQSPVYHGYNSTPVYQEPVYQQEPVYTEEPIYQPEHAGGMDFFGVESGADRSDSFDFDSGGDSSFFDSSSSDSGSSDFSSSDFGSDGGGGGGDW
jgi:uncharacterized membrane protein YgcG